MTFNVGSLDDTSKNVSLRGETPEATQEWFNAIKALIEAANIA